MDKRESVRKKKKRCVVVLIDYPDNKNSSFLTQVAEVQILCWFFIEDLLETLKAIDCDVQIYIEPADKRKEVVQFLGERYVYHGQHGKDAGKKIYDALHEAMTQYESVVAIRTNVPNLPKTLVEKSFDLLKKNDCVLGPTEDGGDYYLIGFAQDKLLRDVFEGISWGSKEILKQTKELLDKQDYAVAMLDEWQNIGSIEDLRNLIRQGRKMKSFRNSKTMRLLQNTFHDY